MNLISFLEDIERTLDFSTIILTSEIQKFFGPSEDTAYVKGKVLFINSSILEFSIFAGERQQTVSIELRRFIPEP